MLDFINTFFQPHVNSLTNFLIGFSFLTPVFILIHKLLDSKNDKPGRAKVLVKNYLGFYETATEKEESEKLAEKQAKEKL